MYVSVSCLSMGAVNTMSPLRVAMCLCVCLQLLWLCSNFWKLWPRNFIFGVQIHLEHVYATFAYQGHRVKVKVTETKINTAHQTWSTSNVNQILDCLTKKAVCVEDAGIPAPKNPHRRRQKCQTTDCAVIASWPRTSIGASRTSLPRVIWEEGRVAALSHTYAVKSPLVTMARPKFDHKKYPFPWADPQTPLSASSLDPSDLWCQTASGSDPPFFHNALDRTRDRQIDRQIVHGKVWRL